MGISAHACHPRVGLGAGTRLCAGSIVLLPFVRLLRARRARVLARDGVSSAQQVLRVLAEVVYPN